MATVAQHVWESAPESNWFWQFLKEELAPYPGRTGTVVRMVIAATLVMIICMTFRVPYGFQGAIYALLISRESPRATLQSSAAILLVTGIGAIYVLISVSFVISVPLPHFLWVIGSLFLAFFMLSAINNYAAASIFAIMISVGVPLWDRHVSAEASVEDTLWLTLAAAIGVVVTAAVELALVRWRPGDEVILPMAERLTAIQNLLNCYIKGRPPDQPTEEKLTSLAIRGTSRFRRLLRRSEYSPQYRLQMSVVVELIGRLVDIAAIVPQLTFELSGKDQKRLSDLAAAVASIRTALLERRIPDSFNADNDSSRGVPLLREMENIVALIPEAFAGSRSRDEYVPPLDDAPPQKLVAPDALTNPEHLHFALKGCLAASLCYTIYTAVAWPGISTAVTTCLLTALSTIGSSRQKQVLRFAGALVGGFLIAMGSQMFILPYLDSITGFTVLFILVTAFASWFMTSSPRLSYFGLQVALAFYLINLQEFAVQTSLSIARDRVVGILFGLLVMWVVFDQLWGASAVVEMKRTFISNLRSLAQLVKEPLRCRSYSLREAINANFDKVRTLADGVLFEVGSPSRQQDLALRSQIRRWQPQLRMLFLTRVALLKYRLQLPGFELPKPIAAAQRAFDNNVASALDAMADRMEGRSSAEQPALKDGLAHLEQTVGTYRPDEPQPTLGDRFEALLSLDRRVESLMTSLTDVGESHSL
jgi:multidrug resistance protein MdtO